MESLFDLCSLIERGGIFVDVEGSTAEEVYSNLSKMIEMPSYCSAEEVAAELCSREKVLSTAVGNGIAIPHPKRPILKNEDEQRIIVCFPKNRLDMHAPDRKSVYVMFIILSESTKFHLQALSALAKVIKSEDFQRFLETKPANDELLYRISKASK